MSHANTSTRPRPRRRWGLIILGGLALCLALVIGLWDWNWFRPIVEAKASAALGRPVTIGRFGVQLGRVVRITADDVKIANPADFPAGRADFADFGRLTVDFDVMDYLHGQRIVLPLIGLDHPVVNAEQLADGRANWSLPTGSSSSGPTPEIGDLAITDGHAHVVDPALKTDFALDLATQPSQSPNARENNQILITARGTYAGQPITGRFIGGALLSLRDKTQPYPVDLHLENGDTHVSLVGTVEQPLSFGGANLKLALSGSDLAKLYPLTGIAIPATPAFNITGNLDYADKKIRFTDFAGHVGASDLEGTIAVNPTGAPANDTSHGKPRPDLTADLTSKNVNLADLGGFIGTTPGNRAEAGTTAANQAAVAKAEASPKLLPQTPINLPKVRAADIHLRYDGRHIEGRNIPFDSIKIALDIDDGRIQLHPIDLAVGHGAITGTAEFAPVGSDVKATTDISFKQVDVSRLMAATHTFQGQGTIGGEARIAGTGASLAQLLGHGNGEIKLFMNGGDLSALLIDLSGLEFGNALLSALGVPQRAQINCMISDFDLQQGILNTKAFLIGTGESNITGTGSVNLDKETLDLQIRTVATHFTIGSLPGPINIGGTLKSPSILPGTEVAVRGGLAAGLGILFPPLALLPTIQLGLGQDNACAKTLAETRK